MKKLLFAAFVIFPFLLFAQNPNKGFNKLYDSVHLSERSIKLNLPGFLVRGAIKATLIADKYDDGDIIDEYDVQLKELRPFVNSIKGAKVVVIEDIKHVDKKQLESSLEELRDDDFVEDLIQVKSDGSTVSVLVAESDDEIRNIFVVVSDNREVVFMNLKLKLDVDQLDELIEAFLDVNSVDEIIMGE